MQNVMDNLYDVIINNKENISNFKLDKNKYYKTDDGEIVLYLSIDNGYTRAHVVMGKGKDLKSALENAVKDYKSNIHFNFKPMSVKLDIVTNVLPILKGSSRINIRKDEVRYRRGEDGLLLSDDFSAAFLPEEVEAYKMIQKRLIQPDKVFDAFEKHFLLDQQKTVKRFLTSQFMDLYKFRTDSWYIDKNEYLPLIRGHRTYNNLDKEDLLSAIELTKDNYFKQSVNPKGKFVYIYNPEDSTVPSKYNILRHAGTTYSMLETYELMPDKGLMRAIERA